MSQKAETLISMVGEKGEIVGLVKDLPSEIRNIIQSYYAAGLDIRSKVGAPPEMDLTVHESLKLMRCHAERMWQHFDMLNDIFENWLDVTTDWHDMYEKGQLVGTYPEMFEDVDDEFTMGCMQDTLWELKENLQHVTNRLCRVTESCRHLPIYRKRRPEWKEPEQFKNKKRKL